MVDEREVSQRGPLGRKSAVAFTASPSPTPSVAPPSDAVQRQPTARRYHSQKRVLSLIRAILGAALTLALVSTGLSKALENVASAVSANSYVTLIGFLLLFGILEGLVTFPVRFLSAFVLEHRFRLSNQSLGAWLWESLKGSLVGAAIGLPLALGFYASLAKFGSLWWAPVGGLVFLVSVVLARIAPTLIFPLFYRFEPVKDTRLRDRLLALGEKAGVSIEGVFVFNMSKTTKKANAAFMGIGRSKRIILGDTLVANFTDEEIETVFAHELGHYKLRHLWIMLLVGFLNTFLGLAACAWAYDALLPIFGFAGRTSIAGLPLLGLLLSAYSLATLPLTNMLSRAHERAADRYAVRLTDRPHAFVHALRKLALVNLAELDPPRLIEFLFHSHPSLQRRIQAVEGSIANP